MLCLFHFIVDWIIDGEILWLKNIFKYNTITESLKILNYVLLKIINQVIDCIFAGLPRPVYPYPSAPGQFHPSLYPDVQW